MGSGKTFEDLNVYKDSLSFLIRIYKLTREERIRTQYGLVDQLKRATLSISNNIAEGFERETDKELARFLYISKGSAGEVRNIINVLKNLNYINEEEYQKLRSEILNFSRQLSSYIKYIIKRNKI